MAPMICSPTEAASRSPQSILIQPKGKIVALSDHATLPKCAQRGVIERQCSGDLSQMVVVSGNISGLACYLRMKVSFGGAIDNYRAGLDVPDEVLLATRRKRRYHNVGDLQET